jgi:hypothetical protein
MKGSKGKNGREPDSDLTPAPSSDALEEETEDVGARLKRKKTEGGAESGDEGLPSPVTPIANGSTTPTRRVSDLQYP